MNTESFNAEGSEESLIHDIQDHIFNIFGLVNCFPLPAIAPVQFFVNRTQQGPAFQDTRTARPEVRRCVAHSAVDDQVRRQPFQKIANKAKRTRHAPACALHLPHTLARGVSRTSDRWGS